MKCFTLISGALLLSTIVLGQQQQFLCSDTTSLQTLEVIAIKAHANFPFAKTELSKKDIEKNNSGRDLPFLINQTPSIQINSDAGNGIGYTGFRIRGTDATRINITINGIPYNDAESQGTFLVNLPDLASSAGSIQIQRGVGSSTNGTGAFGGSIHINTNEVDSGRYLLLNQSYGSYNSRKSTAIWNSGLFGKHFLFNGRLSEIASDGYIDRSQSILRSFYTSTAYVDAKKSIRLNIFSGKEKTHAAWFGINQATLDTNRTYNPAGSEKPGFPYNNETDNYTQTHYQLFYNRKVNDHFRYNINGFLVRGKGYFEQYKAYQALSDYGISSNDTSDLIRQLWLDNYFYGTVFSAQYQRNKDRIIFGGTVNNYTGKHYGIIINTITTSLIAENYKWYDVPAQKSEWALYGKWEHPLGKGWESYLDLQCRNVNYIINGFEKNPTLTVKSNYQFFNPKAGVTYLKGSNKFYFSFSRASKEPNRDDFETGLKEKPKPEQLNDFETGFLQRRKKYEWSINLFYMLYKDQLVLTGKVNEVYAYTRTNIPESFRAGIECEGSITLNKWLSLSGNLTLSMNKITNFNEYYYDYDSSVERVNIYRQSDISFSPSCIGALNLEWKPSKLNSFSIAAKYVGKQYMDNTSHEDRIIRSYWVADARMDHEILLKKQRKITLFLQLYNLFSRKYTANGYTYSYVYGGSLTTENYFFPMATFNLMGGINLKL